MPNGYIIFAPQSVISHASPAQWPIQPMAAFMTKYEIYLPCEPSRIDLVYVMQSSDLYHFLASMNSHSSMLLTPPFQGLRPLSSPCSFLDGRRKTMELGNETA